MRAYLLRSHLHGTVLEVQDGESLVYAASPRLRAGGKDSLHEGLVGLDVVFDKSRLGSDLEELVELKHPDSFDVDWSALEGVTRGCTSLSVLW